MLFARCRFPNEPIDVTQTLSDGHGDHRAGWRSRWHRDVQEFLNVFLQNLIDDEQLFQHVRLLNLRDDHRFLLRIGVEKRRVGVRTADDAQTMVDVEGEISVGELGDHVQILFELFGFVRPVERIEIDDQKEVFDGRRHSNSEKKTRE